MNPSDPDMKNITPLEPAKAAVPGAPLAAATPPVITTSHAAVSAGATPLQNRRTRIIAIVALLAIVLIGYKLFHHHRNAYEATADAVTVAIAHNDMTPVLHKFNAIRVPELEDRERVGRMSNFVTALGAFKGSREITPGNSDAGFHSFTETFANGTAYEKYQLDNDGKIVKFKIGPPPSASSSP